MKTAIIILGTGRLIKARGFEKISQFIACTHFKVLFRDNILKATFHIRLFHYYTVL